MHLTRAMSRLELKVVPDLVALGVGVLMWLVSRITPTLNVALAYRGLVALVLLLAGIFLIAAARVSFARAGTSFSPVSPQRAGTLVTTGVYGRTRNPMYLGTLLSLLALGALLSNPVSAALAGLYAVYITRFQIIPEERVLRVRFGSAYEGYARRVRRWV